MPPKKNLTGAGPNVAIAHQKSPPPQSASISGPLSHDTHSSSLDLETILGSYDMNKEPGQVIIFNHHHFPCRQDHLPKCEASFKKLQKTFRVTLGFGAKNVTYLEDDSQKVCLTHPYLAT